MNSSQPGQGLRWHRVPEADASTQCLDLKVNPALGSLPTVLGRTPKLCCGAMSVLEHLHQHREEDEPWLWDASGKQSTGTRVGLSVVAPALDPAWRGARGNIWVRSPPGLVGWSQEVTPHRRCVWPWRDAEGEGCSRCVHGRVWKRRWRRWTCVVGNRRRWMQWIYA